MSLRDPSEPEGSRPQRYPRDDQCPVPTRDAPPPLPADLVALLSDAHAARTCFADQRNSLPSRSIRWRMTESFRATSISRFTREATAAADRGHGPATSGAKAT